MGFKNGMNFNGFSNGFGYAAITFVIHAVSYYGLALWPQAADWLLSAAHGETSSLWPPRLFFMHQIIQNASRSSSERQSRSNPRSAHARRNYGSPNRILSSRRA